MQYIGIGKVCEMLGISLSTAYRWLKSGKLIEDFRTVGQHRRFLLSYIQDKFLNIDKDKKEKNPAVIAYARVSSYDQKQDLERQKAKLLNDCLERNYQNVTVISDLGSGLNYKKNGLKKLLDLILNQQIDILIINHKDRLLRFGSELIFKICQFYQIKVIILENKEKSFEEDLTQDVIEIMTVFCAKLYGKRSHKNKVLI